jgi:hypothetical protein
MSTWFYQIYGSPNGYVANTNTVHTNCPIKNDLLLLLLLLLLFIIIAIIY